MFYLPLAPKLSAFPSVSIWLYWKRNWGRRKQTPADRQRSRVCCSLLHDGLALSLAILVKLTDWRRSDTAFCFDFLRLLICKCVGWNPGSDSTSREETTRYTVTGYHLHSVTRDPPCHKLSAVVTLTSPNCWCAKTAFWSVHTLVAINLFRFLGSKLSFSKISKFSLIKMLSFLGSKLMFFFPKR